MQEVTGYFLRWTRLIAKRYNQLGPDGVGGQRHDNPGSLDELADKIFSLVIMGDDRAVHAIHIIGELAYERSSASA